MTQTVRFGVSLGEELLVEFDRLIARLGYESRSEAVRDLIRRRLVEEEWEAGDHDVFGTVTIVYDHHRLSVPARLTEIQHGSLANVVGSLHVHVDRHRCMEVIVLKGPARDVRALGDRMIALKGVEHGTLSLGTGKGQLRVES